MKRANLLMSMTGIGESIRIPAVEKRFKTPKELRKSVLGFINPVPLKR
jgi:hypothetical protein